MEKKKNAADLTKKREIAFRTEVHDTGVSFKREILSKLNAYASVHYEGNRLEATRTVS